MLTATLVGPLVCLMTAAAETPPVPTHVLEMAETKRVRGTLTYDISYDEADVQTWIVAVARAPELPSQTKPVTKLEPAGIATSDQSSLRRPLIRARILARTAELGKELSLKVTYEATLHSRRLVPLKPGQVPPKVPPLSATERRNTLTARGDYDFESKVFKEWMKKQGYERREDEPEVDFGKRVFLGMRKSFGLAYHPAMKRNASIVCKDGRSDCGGLSAVFVSVMRANGIPARSLFGRWAESTNPADKIGAFAYHQWHVKSEFFAAGIGWVPVDVLVSIGKDRSKEGLVYFAQDAGDFLTFHVDPDLDIDTLLFRIKRVSALQVPSWWLSSRKRPEGGKTTENWKVETIR